MSWWHFGSWRRFVGPITVIALILFTYSVVRDNRNLRAAVRRFTSGPHSAPSFRAVRWSASGPAGAIEMLKPAVAAQTGPTIIYAIRPGCRYCETNVDAFHSLVTSGGVKAVYVVSLDTEGLAR